MNKSHENRALTVPEIRNWKARSSTRRLTMVTAYDATQGRWCALSVCDLILVGDSLGMVVQGHETTLQVEMAHMIYHTQCVRRGAPHKFIVADLPFGSYQSDFKAGFENAVSLIRAGANAVKMEGSGRWNELIARLTEAGIPVMGHIGLTPQSFHQLGGFRVQGRSTEDANQFVNQGKELERVGCFGLVVESVPCSLAKLITASLGIPTIGIGAGLDVDGQVLVLHDLLGCDQRFQPKFVKRFANLEESVVGAIDRYCLEVNNGSFPSEPFMYV